MILGRTPYIRKEAPTDVGASRESKFNMHEAFYKIQASDIQNTKLF
jgi:hypothetical protein